MTAQTPKPKAAPPAKRAPRSEALGEDTLEMWLVRRVELLEAYTRVMADHLRANGLDVTPFETVPQPRNLALGSMKHIRRLAIEVNKAFAELAGGAPTRATRARGPIVIDNSPTPVRRIVERDEQGRITAVVEVPAT